MINTKITCTLSPDRRQDSKTGNDTKSKIQSELQVKNKTKPDESKFVQGHKSENRTKVKPGHDPGEKS
jgi:hypothetical protein